MREEEKREVLQQRGLSLGVKAFYKEVEGFLSSAQTMEGRENCIPR